MTFLRHARAVPPYGRIPDNMRRLSAKGIRQAEKRRDQLGNPIFDLILCPSSDREVNTARVVAGEDNTAPAVMLYELSTPYSGSICDSLHRLFHRLGHVPLAMYYAHDPADVQEMKQFGASGWRRIMDWVTLKRAANILVVSHGVYPVCMIASADPNKAACLMNLVQPECGGFVVELNIDEHGLTDIISVTPLPPLE